MARKCKSCRTEIPTVKACSEFHMKKGYCSINCTAAHTLQKVRDAADKKGRKEHAQRKRDFNENDLKTRKSAAKLACHRYIRERDRGQPCICCGRELGDKYDAGHFLESGNNPRIRYDEDNIHAQSVYCNQYKGGDSDDYEGRLRLKIGSDKVDYLKANKGGTVKRTPKDYREIEDYFKAKLKSLSL
jgi:hypothetical protein